MTAAQRKQLLDQVRTAVANSGLTLYEIAKRTGIAQSSLSRFMRAERGLSIESLEMLAPVIGLSIVVTGTQRKPKKK